ncbi:HNH endonuclease [Stutzerimonas stutzeri]|uniref:HNH endonuclease n=1 Tax=Stutzerimonas stutzeri TaxID=316 RepID=UPI000775C6E3|nr:HNH endonuclease [Stutzerimonas stutzeri]KXO83805.1 hypothetical protein AYK87_06555 [Stutzerimonas stutzeri]
MKFFWVNLGATFNEVNQGGFLWAPLYSTIEGKDGTLRTRTNRHWDVVDEVRTGDVIFCVKDKRITRVAEAQADAYNAERPFTRGFHQWNKEGRRVDVALHSTARPVYRDEIAEEFMSRFNEHCDPAVFTQHGTINEIYMSHIGPDAGLYLLEQAGLIGAFADRIVDEDSKRKIGATTRETIILARVGQGEFRTNLIKRWNGRCALTGLENPDLLVASHIVPWRLSNNDERLDTDNGLLLATHIDRLFDRGLISFCEQGTLLISDQLGPHAQQVFGLAQYQKLAHVPKGTAQYLARHRQYFKFDK